MSVCKIMVPVRGDGKHEALLSHAVALAKRFDGHVDVVHCRPRADDMLPFGVVVPASVKEHLAASADLVADSAERELKEVFQAYCSGHDMVLVQDDQQPPADRLSIAWHEETGKQPAVVGRLGRLTDVIVLARPDKARNLGYGTLEAALYETGRLLLMVPPKPAAEVGQRMAIGWHGSTETSRAIAVAMPLLTAASDVTVIAVNTGQPMPLSGHALVEYLQAHGIQADLRQPKADAHHVGQTLLAEAASAGADSLLIGAYSQNRLRELVMGGVTRHLIDHADLPVFMTH
ncbi:MAG: universal stress protein [Alphaproteobacteria bacterium]